MSIEENKPIEYVSYNGLGRNPMIWGIPYMIGLAVICGPLLIGMMLGTFINPAGWFFSLVSIPILIFVKVICTHDDKAVGALLLEAKWMLQKLIGGNAKHYGGTMTIAPTTYGRKFKHVKRYFKKTSGG